MNTIAVVILCALLAEHVVNLLADVMNVRASSRALPSEFADTYDPAEYRRAQRYLRETTALGIARSSVSLIALLAFWFLGGFEWLDTLVRSFGWTLVPTGLAFFGLLGLMSSMLSLPFSIYATFSIEERYGFNRTSWKTFILDMIKAALLSIVLGAPLLAAVLWFFDAAGSGAWFYSWLLLVSFMIIVQFVAPRWIMPLFNRFSPLEDGALKSAVLEYARSVDFAVDDVYVVDGSRRSSKANAFFTGFGRNRRIALFDTLIAKHGVDELVAVLAHEIGHFKQRHILKNLAIGVVHTAVLFLLLSLVLDSRPLFEAFYMDQMSLYAGFVFFGLLYSPVEFVLGVVLNALSRRYEFEADAYAARTTRRPSDLVAALKKMSVDHLSNLSPHRLEVLLHYSHPPVLHRIRALRSADASS